MKIINWLKRNYILIGIIILAIAIRLYFFILTKNQPLWWDESSYLSIAKHWAFNMPYNIVPYGIEPHRPVILPLLSALIFKLGLSVLSIKFFLIFIPSVAVVLMSYVLFSKYFDKKRALVISTMLAVSWVVLFNTFRVHVDVPLTFLTLLTIFIFLEGYTKKSSKLMILAGILLGLTFLSKFTAFLLVLALLIFALPKLFKRKEVFLFFLFTFLVLLGFLIYSYLSFGNAFQPFIGGSHLIQYAIGQTEEIPGLFKEIKWIDFQQFKSMLLWPFFIFFLIGIPIFFKFVLYMDKVLKNPNKEESLKIILTLFSVLGVIFFIFIQRYMEPRLIMPISLTLFVISAEGIVWVYEKIRKHQKIVAFIFIILILFIGSFAQISKANKVIQQKKDSYGPIRDAGIWLKLNTPIDAKILSISFPQTSFYSERKVIGFSRMNSSQFDELLIREEPDYLMLSIFEYHDSWMYLYPQEQNLTAVKTYAHSDNQLVLAIYKLK